MIFKRIIAVFILVFCSLALTCAEDKKAPESDQQISDFSLSGYGDKGNKSWDLAGKSADIFTENIKLKDVIGNLYGEQENINLTANKGDFNKTDGRVHLEENVVVTTTGGAKLTTNSLDWDRKQQVVSTPDKVNIEKENMVTVAQGAIGKPNLHNITLKKDVTVTMNPKAPEKELQNQEDKMVITCDGPLEIDYDKNIAIFNNNVKVDRPDSQIFCDMMHVYFIPGKGGNKEAAAATPALAQTPSLMSSKIDKLIAKGNVKIIKGENISYSEEAIYTAADKKIVLTGRPKLVIYSTKDLGTVLNSGTEGKKNAPSGS